MRAGQITALTLGGFQVFRERTRFPLGPLTLLYGPNSAGKSAIYDAIQVLFEFTGRFREGAGEWDELGHVAGRLLERHWRVERGSPPVLAEDLHIGAELVIDRLDWARESFIYRAARGSGIRIRGDEIAPTEKRYQEAIDAFLPWLQESDLESLELVLRVQLKNWFGRDMSALYASGRGDRFDLPFSASIALAGIPLLEAGEGCGLALNVQHPAVGGLGTLEAVEHLARTFPSYFQRDGGWIRCRHYGPAPDSSGVDYDTFTVLVQSDDNDDGGHFDELCEDGCWTIVNLVDAIWLSSLRCVHRGLEAGLVPASRSVPTRRELTYLLDENGDPLHEERLGLGLNPRAEFAALAGAALHSTLGDESPSWNEHRQRARERMNSLLAEHLFKERGYYLAADVHLLQPVGVATRSGEGRSLGDEDEVAKPQRKMASYLVNLVLVDVHGRRLAFDEVGSGIGYALPVLWAVASKRVTFIQQPELHLHPALQAELADAFVAGLNTEEMVKVAETFARPWGRSLSRQHIVETHSEHLLLRLLRRIRQGNQVDRAGDPLSLKRDDLVVLYVEPAADGSSSVKHLRVDRNGDFLDRWPRGFFEERWRELSGE